MEEAFGNDSTKFVKVPWDVLQSYHFRASRAVMAVPEASRLTWLEEKDIADRSAWVSQYREGDELLGQVVHSVMEERGGRHVQARHMVRQALRCLCTSKSKEEEAVY